MTVGLAFSTNAYTRFSVGEACRKIAEAGYRGVEILADEPHAYPHKQRGRVGGSAPSLSRGRFTHADSFDISAAKKLRAWLDKLGLAVSNVNANTLFGFWRDPPPEPFFEPSLISEKPQLRRVRLQAIRQALDFAARIGAANISITIGKPLGAMSPEACEPVLEDMLGRVLRSADQFGVNVGIECEPGLLIETTDELLAWIRRMNSPRLGANLDIGHAVVAGEDPVEAIRKLRGRIWNLHLEDIRGRKHYHRIPGEGDVDFRAIAAALREINYDGWATVELYTQSANPDRAARESLRVLGPVFA